MKQYGKVLSVLAVAFAFLALAPAAHAAPKNVVETIGQGGTGDGEFAFPLGIAINQTSGDFYVADGECCSFETGGQRVLQFSAEGDFIRAWGWGVATGAAEFEICTSSCRAGIRGSGPGQFSLELGDFVFTSPQVAVDQSDGSVYVADNGNDRIQKFSASGAYLGEFGGEGSANGQFELPLGVAVDPVSDDVYVADAGNNRIQRFDSSGTHLATIGSAAGGAGDGEFVSPRRVGVDSIGRLYVIDSGNGRVQRFTAAGAFDQVFAAGQISSPTDLAVDPADDHVYIAAHNADSSVQAIFEFEPDGTLLDAHAANSGINGFPAGVAVRSSTDLIYASSPLTPKAVMVLDEVNAPSATIDPVTVFDADSAELSGQVNPNGDVDANWRFQISADGGTSWSDVGPGGTVPEGTTAQPVSDEATGLEPNTTYQARLVASKPFLGEQGIDTTSFTTDPVGPLVTALDPGPVTANTAWLGGYVDPRNTVTTYYIEYSIDPGFASSTSLPSSEDAAAGSGGVPVFVNQLAQGLLPDTTYHYRVVATNVAGTTTGESRSFTTAAPASAPPAPGLPDGRVWEKVSPAFKAGAHVNAGNYQNIAVGAERSQASIHGDAVVFGSDGKFAGGEGAPTVSQYLARRGPNGWSTESLSPRMNPAVGEVNNINYFQLFTPDLSKGLVTTHAALNPGDPDNVYNLYLRDNDTRSYTTVSEGDASTPARTWFESRGVSDDGGHIIYQHLGGDVLMEMTPSGDRRPVSVLPDESVVEGWLGGAARGFIPGLNSISEDGSRIFFSPASNGSGPVYVREDGQSTRLISASEDEPSVPRSGDFLAASKDGSVAFFRSSEALTDGALGSSSACQSDSAGSWTGQLPCNLYRWDGDAPAGEQLKNLTAGDPQGAHALGVVGVSDDGDAVYFVAFGNLDGSGNRSQPILYLWREGEGVRFVAKLLGGQNETDWGLWSRWSIDIQTGDVGDDEPARPARVTPDGRYLAFSTHIQQTGYDTNGKQAIYLYDSETARISCLSCGSVEPKSKGNSWFVSCGAEDASETACEALSYLPRNFRDDGRRLFFDSADALVPADTNGVTDVYEWQDGQLHLISSGTSGFPSRFVDAGASGDDVFFVTAQRLTASDQDDLRDLYDARAGGRPEPNVPRPCVADECQGTPSPAPNFGTPSSLSFRGPGSPAVRKGKARCRQGKVRRRGRCQARKVRKREAEQGQQKKRAYSRADSDRRAGR